jgi:hypothetical protein
MNSSSQVTRSPISLVQKHSVVLTKILFHDLDSPVRDPAVAVFAYDVTNNLMVYQSTDIEQRTRFVEMHPWRNQTAMVTSSRTE